MPVTTPIAILGAGNIGAAAAHGLVRHGAIDPGGLILTRRHEPMLEPLATEGFRTTTDNVAAVRDASIVIAAVGPGELDDLLEEIASSLDEDRHVLVSLVTGAAIEQIRRVVGPRVPVIRAMPNTSIALGESMTCLAAEEAGAPGLDGARELFDLVGKTLVIEEEQMTAATALCACGVAFFLRAIRAASQGGIEIGFHSEEAYTMASQTAKGAASLLLAAESHPESEIDRVTTPRGCTIAGLNEMEHRGFSSALIKGIVKSAVKAGGLYVDPDTGS